MGLRAAQSFAQRLGFVFDFDWDQCRTEEGYYQINGCIDLCVARALVTIPKTIIGIICLRIFQQYSKHCDMLWMETPTPRLDVAREFSQRVKAVYPNKFLCYNLSPSFNWDAGHLTDNDIRNFCTELGKLGYCWQVKLIFSINS